MFSGEVKEEKEEGKEGLFNSPYDIEGIIKYILIPKRVSYNRGYIIDFNKLQLIKHDLLQALQCLNIQSFF